MKDVLVIMGSHTRSRGEFDFSRTDCDVWIFNEALMDHGNNGFMPRADMVFQMHEETIWRNPNNRNDPGHAAWLKSGKTPAIMMQDEYSDVPRSQRYPLGDLSALLLPEDLISVTLGDERKPLRFFTSSMDYALAYAAYLHKTSGSPKRVELYGAEMETNTEYMFQRPGLAFWIGYLAASGMGLDLHTLVFDVPLYGYEGEVVLPDNTFQKRLDELKPQLLQRGDEYKASLHAAKKLLEQLAYEDVSKDLFPMLAKQMELGVSVGLIDGAMQENQRYAAKADAMRQTTEKFLFSRQEFETARAKLGQKSQEFQANLSVMSGQMQLVHDNVIHAARGSAKRKKLVAAYGPLVDRYLALSNMMAVVRGASEENGRYMAILERGVRAAGGEKSEAAILDILKGANDGSVVG